MRPNASSTRYSRPTGMPSGKACAHSPMTALGFSSARETGQRKIHACVSRDGVPSCARVG